MGKIGRNDPCPCGSGKKYKRCCLGLDIIPFPAVTDYPQGSFTEAERASAARKLLDFASTEEFSGEREIGLSLFWGGRLSDRSDEEIQTIEELDEQFQINFNTWSLFDADIDDGKTIAEFFLEREGPRLKSGERAYLTEALKTHFRLYEVENVDLDQGFLLKDLWTGESCQVRERSATHFLVKWDLMATRLMKKENDIWEIDGGIFNFPARTKAFLLKELRSYYKQFQRVLPGKDDTAFFKRHGMMFNHWWLDCVIFPPLPRLVNADREPILLTKMVFAVKDPGRLAAALEQHPDMECMAKGAYSWREEIPDGYRPLATLTVRKNRLSIEAFSEERAGRCRRLLEEIAGDSITYQATEYQEPAQAIKSHRDEKPRKMGEIPQEIQATLIKTFLDRHYMEWLDQEIPALSNRTPRHAVTLKTFRPRVIDLLKELENMEAHAARQGKIPYDFGWLWKELGLEKERDT